jgi:hypothetical protein
VLESIETRAGVTPALFVASTLVSGLDAEPPPPHPAIANEMNANATVLRMAVAVAVDGKSKAVGFMRTPMDEV